MSEPTNELQGRTVVRKFISYYKNHQKVFYADLLCATVLAVIDLAFPQLLNFFTRDFFLRPSQEVFAALGLIFIGLVCMYAIRTGCQYFITCWGHIMGARMEAEMREDLFNQYQKMSFSYYDKNNTGEMMSRLVTDLFDISELAHHGPENFFICAIKIIGSFALLFMINVPLTLIMLAITVVMVVYSIAANYKKRIILRENRETMARINAQSQDSLGGIRVVKSFGNEAVENDKFLHSNRDFLDTKERWYTFMGQFHSIHSVFSGALYITTLVGGGYFMVKGQILPTDLAIYALYIGIFLAPVETLVNFMEQFQKGYAGFRRFTEIMMLNPDIQEKPNARPLNVTRGDIVFNHVSFSYDPKNPVLTDLNLHVKSGSTVALVGPSGGGKTTLCSLLPRFYDNAQGSITIDGVDIKDVTLQSLRNACGMVQQDVYLFNGTIYDNIAYSNPNASYQDVICAAQQANIHDDIMAFEDGYDTIVGERGARLSGGQKQRISIARLFLRNPSIIILDEATSALDNESEHRVQESLERLSHNRTTLIIAHRLSTIQNANHIAVVDNGHIVEEGTHADLIKQDGVYARYCAMQFGTNAQ